ncbi:DivIVA domain-containing protein [Arthrobacter gengyunqii]|uniref:DivIVA domain-containing protein n=1 Tax=Arthrobacter gengyunqii TaxID=2886940 RepID=A0A9X1M2L0_9MICC|nr:DivIVA domain-containing protein [Arthrobacter gengyunqii]MCC3266456.1 DivIVA domain-containing protein [Arthrobacter gengyunqii]MCC3269765.1 DivIVA domain-containing protein [Arthrobacter gengyunqii]UOY97218.1 DivIVA domain-containing protein [Arthrobacter gengyunqii]
MDEARQASAPFECVGRREYGYNTRQVDEFLAKARSYYNAESPAAKAITSRDVRSMAFDPAKAGYEPQAVDAALDRLEDVFAQRERDQLIQDKGEEAWLLQIGRTSAVLRGRLHRKPGERFRRPSKRKVPSYNVQDVDALCNELLGYFENDKPLSVDVVRRAVFREAKGPEGYEETQVDVFLDRVVELMASID